MSRGSQFLTDFFEKMEKIAITAPRRSRYAATHDPYNATTIKILDNLVKQLHAERKNTLNSRTVDKIITELYTSNDEKTIDKLFNQAGIKPENYKKISDIKTQLYPKTQT